MMRYIDVCSGISAPTAAWKPLGWQALCYAEIEAAPRAVLAHHYPDVPLVGDFTQIKGTEYGPVDLLVGGTPCQSFSIAGLRGGLADDRGNLALEYLRLADRARPRWLVWENVPGVLSSNGGRDFGTFLGALGQLGYGFAYRVLDAQFFGVPQRRRRVFVVGYLGDWRRAAAVLFERHSLSGNPPPRRQARQVAPTIPSRSSAGGGLGTDFDCDGGLVAYGGNNQAGPIDIATALNSHGGPHGGPHGRLDFESETFIAPTLLAQGNRTGGDRPPGTTVDTIECLVPVAAIQERAISENPSAGPDGAGFRTDGQAYTLEARTVPQAVAFDLRGRDDGSQFEGPHDTANIRASSGGSSRSYVAQSAVRRLTPRECERLQGFPDAGPDGIGVRTDDTAYTLEARSVPQAVAFMENQQGAVWESDTAQALNKGGGKPGQGYAAVRYSTVVRRLTPIECEALQGFPRNFTLVPTGKDSDRIAEEHIRYMQRENGPLTTAETDAMREELAGKWMADGPRYKALGNSMAVPVVRWIGERIQLVDSMSVMATDIRVQP